MSRVFSRAVIASACTALLLAISPARGLAACPGTATGQLTSVGPGEGVTGTINGSAHSAGFAGVIFATINAQPNVPAFCINLLNGISINDCFNTGGPTSPQITWLLNHGFGPDNTQSNFENAARQAAVWYFSDSFITTDSHQARVQQIIDAVPANPDPQQDVPQMNIDPPSAVNVLPGNTIHSLTVNVTTGGQPLVGQVVNLSTSFGTLSSSTVTTDGSGSATFTVTNTSGTPGTANITATFTYPLPAGTIFNPVVEGKQKLVLASPTSGTLVANATKQWVNGGTIIAHKFLDSNLDTTQDPDEPNLSNWTMKLFSCNAVCDGTGCTLIAGAAGTKTTDANGDANFGSKAAGCYRVDEVFPTPVDGHQDWHNTTTASQLFLLASNQAKQVVFGNIIYSVIVVQKFEDLDGDGVQEGNEPFLDGWRMMLQRLVSGTWIPLKEDLTSGGQVVFSDLPPGHYRIQEELQSDWANTTGNPVEFDVGSDSIVNVKFGNKPPTCDDQNPCTDDSFDLVTGCMHVDNIAPCDDGNQCTQNDQCSGGVCAGAQVSCDDGNVCNGTETCNAQTGCVPGTPLSCDDGDACNGTETCNAQTGCVPGTPLSCDDHDACNGTETCNPQAGCVPGTPLSCDDHDACNGTETCNPQTGCVPGTPLSCDDHDACNGTETCNPQIGCVPGTPLNCNDNNVCTDDSCNPATGCTYVNNHNPCDDGNACTTADTCSGSTCTGGPAANCDDGNACTVDSCVAPTGCIHGAVPACCSADSDCADTDQCTTNERCVTHACVSDPVVCNDQNACTDDSCNPATGCTFVNNNHPCDDGNACTTADACSGGTCQGGPPQNCGTASPTITVSETPTPSPTPTRTGICALTPVSGCMTPVGFNRRIRISLKRDITTWRWRTTEAIPLSDYGDPVHVTGYSLCVYAGASPTLVQELHASAGGTCSAKPCWKPRNTKGFRYRDHSGSQSGLIRIVLRAGPAQLADLRLKAKGPNVPIPALPLAEPVLAQFVQSGGAKCWQANYASPALKNNSQLFRDKND